MTTSGKLPGMHSTGRSRMRDWTATPPFASACWTCTGRSKSYPEAAQALRRLRSDEHAVAILSNGSVQMLEAAVSSAGIDDLVDAVLSVDPVGVFKPDPRVYRLLCKQFDCEPAAVAFVSANGWDAAAGAGFGFRSVWVNRESAPQERLPWSPEVQVRDLSEVPDAVRAMRPGVPA